MVLNALVQFEHRMRLRTAWGTSDMLAMDTKLLAMVTKLLVMVTNCLQWLLSCLQ